MLHIYYIGVIYVTSMLLYICYIGTHMGVTLGVTLDIQIVIGTSLILPPYWALY